MRIHREGGTGSIILSDSPKDPPETLLLTIAPHKIRTWTDPAAPEASGQMERASGKAQGPRWAHSKAVSERERVAFIR